MNHDLNAFATALGTAYVAALRASLGNNDGTATVAKLTAQYFATTMSNQFKPLLETAIKTAADATE